MRVGLRFLLFSAGIYAGFQTFAERRMCSLSEGGNFAQRERSDGEANNANLQ